MSSIDIAKQLAESLIQKMAWESQCKPLLRLYKVSIALGADATKVRLFSELEKSEVYAQKFIEQLHPHYLDLLYSGDSTVKIFDVNPDVFHSVYNELLKIEPEETLSSEHFPYLVPLDSLSQLSKTTHFTHKAEFDGALYLFFSTNRTITERTNINPSTLDEGDEIKAFLKKYSMVTALSEKPRQYIDVICLNPHDNTIELRLDTSSTVAAKDINKLFIEVQEAFMSIITRPDGLVFNNAMNFFPLINLLYESESCRVCELNFISAGGYVHSERDRNRAGTGDVRRGDFHIGGVDKCDITPYRISARWESGFTQEIKYDYELSLNSTYRELSKPEGGFLDYAIISLCPTVGDMNEILTTLKQKNELSKAS